MSFTREAILRLAREIGLSDQEDKLVHFAALVAKNVLEQASRERQASAVMYECRPRTAGARS